MSIEVEDQSAGQMPYMNASDFFLIIIIIIMHSITQAEHRKQNA